MALTRRGACTVTNDELRKVAEVLEDILTYFDDLTDPFFHNQEIVDQAKAALDLIDRELAKE